MSGFAELKRMYEAKCEECNRLRRDSEALGRVREFIETLRLDDGMSEWDDGYNQAIRDVKSAIADAGEE